MELSKAENKIARTIIKEGMMVEFERGMRAADNILNDWRQGKGGNHQEAFHTLYRHITLFNKGIAARYDGMKNYNLPFVVIQQVQEGLVPRAVLSGFSEETQKWMNKFL